MVPVVEKMANVGSSPHTGSLHFLTRRDTRKQPEKYSASLYRDE